MSLASYLPAGADALASPEQKVQASARPVMSVVTGLRRHRRRIQTALAGDSRANKLMPPWYQLIKPIAHRIHGCQKREHVLGHSTDHWQTCMPIDAFNVLTITSAAMRVLWLPVSSYVHDRWL
jgi:hypothetical protein